MDKSKLLKARAGKTRDVPVDGGTVKVRSLTRAEAFELRGKGFDEEVLERKILALAMVDPALTEDEVAQWQQVAPSGELDDVVGVVSEMSGMVKNADKEAYKSPDE